MVDLSNQDNANKAGEQDNIAQFMRYMLVFIYAHIPSYAAVSVIYDFELVLPVLLQVLLAGIITIAYMGFRNHPVGYDLASMAIAATPAVLVYMLSGHPWQIDGHMYFFATLAMVTGFKSIRALIMAAGIIAIHHLILNFTLPLAIFPDGTSSPRVLFHAIIVAVETAVIAYIIFDLKRNDRRILEESQAAYHAAKQEAQSAEKERKEQEERQAEERRQEMNKMADDFDNRVGKIVEAVNSAAQQMQSMASSLASSVEQTSQQSSSVASAAQEAASNVETVASAAEELSSSIKEISGNISKTSEVAQQCTDAANDSQQKLDDLQSAVGEIDNVIQQINDVAEQTNLLALNATIEAAHAGEAGKGFAVVANEVKSLAGQTHEMTDEITNKVSHIKSSANGTIESIQNIVSQIADVDERAANVASSVEEQNSSTDEISRNIQQASQGTNEVSKNIEGIQQAANDSVGSTEELKKAADDLAKQADDLNKSVKEFLDEVRS